MWSFFSKDPSKELVNFEIQESVQLDLALQEKTVWSLNNSKKKTNATTPQQNELFSVFSYQVKQGNESWVRFIACFFLNHLYIFKILIFLNQNKLPAAKNGFKRMKMLRHPNILMFHDGVESDKGVFIATERVQPLLNYLKESKESESQKENEISYGLYQIAVNIFYFYSRLFYINYSSPVKFVQ